MTRLFLTLIGERFYWKCSSCGHTFITQKVAKDHLYLHHREDYKEALKHFEERYIKGNKRDSSEKFDFNPSRR